LNTWLQLMLTTLAWAATFHLGKFLVDLMPPISAAVWRFVIATACLIPLVTWREGWPAGALRRSFWALLFMGAVGISGFQLGMFYGLQTSTAVNAALIMGFNPGMTVALAALVERRAIGGLQLLGLILGFVGIIVVATGASVQVLLNLQLVVGDLYLALGGLAWACYSVVLRLHVRDLSVMQISASTIMIGMLSMAAGSMALLPGGLQLPPPAAWPALLVMGVVGSAMAYIWWNSAVMRVGAGRAAAFSNLVPVMTILMGVALGQSITAAQLVGAGLVIAGVVLATRY